jgi:hypothetical protein
MKNVKFFIFILLLVVRLSCWILNCSIALFITIIIIAVDVRMRTLGRRHVFSIFDYSLINIFHKLLIFKVFLFFIFFYLWYSRVKWKINQVKSLYTITTKQKMIRTPLSWQGVNYYPTIKLMSEICCFSWLMSKLLFAI